LFALAAKQARRLAFPPASKTRANKFYIFRQYMYIVYMYNVLIDNIGVVYRYIIILLVLFIQAYIAVSK